MSVPPVHRRASDSEKDHDAPIDDPGPLPALAIRTCASVEGVLQRRVDRDLGGRAFTVPGPLCGESGEKPVGGGSAAPGRRLDALPESYPDANGRRCSPRNFVSRSIRTKASRFSS